MHKVDCLFELCLWMQLLLPCVICCFFILEDALRINEKAIFRDNDIFMVRYFYLKHIIVCQKTFQCIKMQVSQLGANCIEMWIEAANSKIINKELIELNNTQN